MRKKSRWNRIVIVAGVLLIPLYVQAQGTAFTYQGYLDAGGTPHDGLADFEFSLWNAATGGTQQGSTQTEIGVEIENGLFTVELDFGDQFPGAARWLAIAVRTNAAAYTTLAPRQRLTATPYAVTAGRVTGSVPAGQLSGTVPSANLDGTYSGPVTFNNVANTFAGDGSGLTVLNASSLTSGTVPPAALDNAWKVGGNTGTTPGTDFIGTSDNQALELHVNSTRALRIEPNTAGAPNMIGGASVNYVEPGVVGATVGGGGATNYASLARINQVVANFGTVGGGGRNTVDGYAGTVGGGWLNTASGTNTTVSGGRQNFAAGRSATVGGGEGNVATTNYATAGGGWLNTATRPYATIAGGRQNLANAETATIAGGYLNTASDAGATVAGGYQNNASDPYTSIGGGWINTASSPYASVGGGFQNTAGNSSARVGGGVRNTASGLRASVGGGFSNTASAVDSTIGGGWGNIASGTNSTVAGGYQNSAHRIGATVGGGRFNTASNDYATVGGGQYNVASGASSAVGGGRFNTADTWYATVGGGWNNRAAGGYTTVAGGYDNNAIGQYATVSGGYTNSATGDYATVPGGTFNAAQGAYSFAAGRRAKAHHDGSFVWADSTDYDFGSITNNTFNIRAVNGVRIFGYNGINFIGEFSGALITGGGSPFSPNAFEGVRGHDRWGLFKEAGAIQIGIPDMSSTFFRVVKYQTTGTFTPLMSVDYNGVVTAANYHYSSSREKKESFEDVEPLEVLARVSSLPVTRWNYKGNSSAHIGPMSEDFHAAFGLNGNDDKHISASDISGVALAAIQGLNLKVEDEVTHLRNENQALRERLEQLEQLMADHLGVGSL